MAVSVGRHVAVAREFDFGQGETGKQTPYVRVSFEVVEGDSTGEFISWYGYLSDATADRTLESLRICGWDGDELDEELPGMGKFKVSLVVDADEYEGKIRNRVRWVNRLSTNTGPKPEKNRLGLDVLAQINAKLGVKIASLTPEEGVVVDKFTQASRTSAGGVDSTEFPVD